MWHRRVNISAILVLLSQLLRLQVLLSLQHQAALKEANLHLPREQPIQVQLTLKPIPLGLGLCWA